MILAKTLKGKYFGEKIENELNWHGKDIGEHSQPVIDHLNEAIKNKDVEFKTFAPEGEEPKKETGEVKINPDYTGVAKISTRKAYGNGLLRARESN